LEAEDGNPSGYLPGDPRYGLQGEALKDYYRTKPAQWAIYCWDKPGTAETRRALLTEQKSYIKNFGERVIGYGHFVSDDGRDPLGTSFFMQLDDRASADKFVADEPLHKAGVYQRVEIHRWSKQFWQARRRLSPQGFAAVPVHRTQDRHARVLPRAPARPRILLRVLRRQLHLPRADPLGRRRRQHRHRAATRTAGSGRGGQVLEQRAVCKEWRLSEGCADHPLGV
jgi:uncharacterized protein